MVSLNETQPNVETVVAIENRYHTFLHVLFLLGGVRPLHSGERFPAQQMRQAHLFLPTIKCDFVLVLFKKIDESSILEYLGRKGFEYKENAEEYIVRECMFCPKPHYNKPDNLYKLY